MLHMCLQFSVGWLNIQAVLPTDLFIIDLLIYSYTERWYQSSTATPGKHSY